jgi:hypothetical protein
MLNKDPYERLEAKDLLKNSKILEVSKELLLEIQTFD